MSPASGDGGSGGVRLSTPPVTNQQVSPASGDSSGYERKKDDNAYGFQSIGHQRVVTAGISGEEVYNYMVSNQ